MELFKIKKYTDEDIIEINVLSVIELLLLPLIVYGAITLIMQMTISFN